MQILWLLVGVAGGVGRVVPLLSAWHYEDLMRDSGSKPLPSAMVIYSSDWCLEAFRSFDLTEFPSRSHLFLGSYDVEQRVWWRDSRVSLEDRFKIVKMPALVFLPQGEGAFEVWQGETADWRDWLWERLVVDVAVENAVAEDVDLFVRDNVVKLAPGDTHLVERQTPGTILTYRVQGNDYSFEVSRSSSKNNETSCANTKDLRFVIDAAALSTILPESLDAFLNQRDQDTTFTHAAICRQPPKMPAFERVSAYEAIDMPLNLKTRLWAFYENHDRSVEDYATTSTAINVNEIETTMVHLDQNHTEKHFIATSLIQPLVETWAQRPLEFTSFYGIREYHRGHELRMHVDRVATHVFSVIINLHQENMDADWPLDVIHFDGTPGSVILKPGQMLFYQSAKLIHGRPQPLEGSLYANCFCHFRPTDWPYDYGAGDILYHNSIPIVDYKVD